MENRNANNEVEGFFSVLSDEISRMRQQETKVMRVKIDCSCLSEPVCNSLLSELEAEKNKRSAAVYWFEVDSPASGVVEKVYDAVLQYKNDIEKASAAGLKSQERAVSYVPKVCNGSNVLYVGKVERNLKKRFKEHLGFGSASMTSLQLCHWAGGIEGLDLKLVFCYILFDRSSLGRTALKVMEVMEDYFARQKKPLLGRHA